MGKQKTANVPAEQTVRVWLSSNGVPVAPLVFTLSWGERRSHPTRHNARRTGTDWRTLYVEGRLGTMTPDTLVIADGEEGADFDAPSPHVLLAAHIATVVQREWGVRVLGETIFAFQHALEPMFEERYREQQRENEAAERLYRKQMGEEA